MGGTQRTGGGREGKTIEMANAGEASQDTDLVHTREEYQVILAGAVP